MESEKNVIVNSELTMDPLAFHPDIWRVIVLHLNVSDMTSVALLSRAAANLVRTLKGKNIKPQPGPFAKRPHLVLHPEQPRPVIGNLFPLDPKKSWVLADMALPVDGLWLVMLHREVSRKKSDFSSVCVDMYRRTSLITLAYEHVSRQTLSMYRRRDSSLVINSPLVLGCDNDREKPGIYFWGDRDRIDSYHLNEHSAKPLTQILDPDTQSVRLHRNGDDIQLYEWILSRSNDVTIRKMVLTQTGEIQSTFTYPSRRLANVYVNVPVGPTFVGALSPNGQFLLTLCSDGRPYCKNTQTGETTTAKQIGKETLPKLPYRPSITDDGLHIYIGNDLYHNGESECILDSEPLTLSVHSGRGRIVLYAAFDGSVRQLSFGHQTSLAPLTCTLAELGLDLLDRLSKLSNHYCDHIQQHRKNEYLKKFCDDIQSKVSLSNPATLWNLVKSNYALGQNVFTWSTIADCITLNAIIRFADSPDSPIPPHQIALKAIAQSDWVDDLRAEKLQNWYDNPRQLHVEGIGTLHSNRFLYGPPPEACPVHELMGVYAETKSSSKQDIFKSLFESNWDHSNTLTACAREEYQHCRRADIFSFSRNKELDEKLKKLIPKKLRLALLKHDSLRNYIILDALLIKLIRWTKPGKAKNELDEARKRLLKAVEMNPSLRFDMNQLWYTRFFNQPSLSECIDDKIYRWQLIKHFKIDNRNLLEDTDEQPATLKC